MRKDTAVKRKFEGPTTGYNNSILTQDEIDLMKTPPRNDVSDSDEDEINLMQTPPRGDYIDGLTEEEMKIYRDMLKEEDLTSYVDPALPETSDSEEEYFQWRPRHRGRGHTPPRYAPQPVIPEYPDVFYASSDSEPDSFRSDSGSDFDFLRTDLSHLTRKQKIKLFDDGKFRQRRSPQRGNVGGQFWMEDPDALDDSFSLSPQLTEKEKKMKKEEADKRLYGWKDLGGKLSADQLAGMFGDQVIGVQKDESSSDSSLSGAAREKSVAKQNEEGDKYLRDVQTGVVKAGQIHETDYTTHLIRKMRQGRLNAVDVIFEYRNIKYGLHDELERLGFRKMMEKYGYDPDSEQTQKGCFGVGLKDPLKVSEQRWLTMLKQTTPLDEKVAENNADTWENFVLDEKPLTKVTIRDDDHDLERDLPYHAYYSPVEEQIKEMAGQFARSQFGPYPNYENNREFNVALMKLFLLTTKRPPGDLPDLRDEADLLQGIRKMLSEMTEMWEEIVLQNWYTDANPYTFYGDNREYLTLFRKGRRLEWWWKEFTANVYCKKPARGKDPDHSEMGQDDFVRTAFRLLEEYHFQDMRQKNDEMRKLVAQIRDFRLTHNVDRDNAHYQKRLNRRRNWSAARRTRKEEDRDFKDKDNWDRRVKFVMQEYRDDVYTDMFDENLDESRKRRASLESGTVDGNVVRTMTRLNDGLRRRSDPIGGPQEKVVDRFEALKARDRKVRSYRKRETSPYKLHKISKYQSGRSYYYEPNLWDLIEDVPELKERIEEEAEAEAERVEREAERARKRRKRAEDSE